MKSTKEQPGTIQIIPIVGMGEVKLGEDLAETILNACSKSGIPLQDNDILVVTHKIVSKSEGRVLDLDAVTPSKFALKAGKHIGKDPRQVEIILSESRRLVKMVKGLIIAETAHGFVCANAGVDQSNVESGKIVLLPKRPDDSAKRIRNLIRRREKIDVAIIISDTFGRPWREGQVDVAIGIAGIDPFWDYRGITDQYGYNLKATVICTADELASAAELCMNKLDRVPAVVIRGYKYKQASNVSSRALARKPSRDLFR
ncbi:MAG TPA: coenzyme F420-0:L-glutamate ligase [Nitrososphaerales archaeon]|nr:coenzyme F420-0:L-glutamate ligase [Nitrososphaerales archaeon]